MTRPAQDWIQLLQLQPHPEGGYYRETYRSAETIARPALPRRYKGDRAFATAIYFLLGNDQYSAFHRLKSDEIWHFYDGWPICLYVIANDGRLTTAKLGLNAEKGERPQFVINAGSWFAAALAIQNPKSKIENRKYYALVGCTVAPGFDFADFEMGGRQELIDQFPQHRVLIEKMTSNPDISKSR